MADTKDSLRKKRLAYVRTFCGDREVPHLDGEAVLADLRKVCGLTKPGIVVSTKSGMVDSHASIYQAGMRDVYLRIVGMLSIDERHLFQGDTHADSQSQTAER